MKIAIDVSSVVYKTGVSVYTQNLVNNLTKLDHKNNYLLFGGSLRQFNNLKSSFSSQINSKYYRLPPLAMNYLFNYTNIPVNLFTGKIDLYHASDWTQPVANCPVITTVHDLAPIKYPEFTPDKIVKTHKIRLERAKKQASKIIAVSQNTKDDLVEMGFDENKITVIYEAADKLPVVSVETEARILQKFNLQKNNFLLNIGTNPRKNNKNISQAFEKLKHKGIAEKFVVTGNVASSRERNPSEALLRRQAGLAKGDTPQTKINNVNYLGFVSDEELAVLYNNAACLVYASMYEGFGIPILQAYESNCPVVTSKISSLPEVAGNAAILVDPGQPEDIAKGVVSALKNKNSLTKKGRLQAKKFSWPNCAKQTLEVYNSLQ